jgi:7-keto-8-aminopelargonate synthetase-like enzyme
LIICDTHAHNSIQMAAKLCVAEGVELARLPHNDMSALEEFVSKPEHEGRRLWFLGDGIYSMQGEFLDLDNLVQTLNRHPNLYAYIDDAHGFGWSGKNGAGFVLGGGSSHPQLITTVSMCKSFGSFGGVAVFPDESLADRLRHVGQTQVFSSPLPTAVLGASVASAKIHLSDQLPSYQAELEEKIRYFKSECNRVGLPIRTKSHTPIQFIEIGTNAEVYPFVQKLMDRGLYCSSAVFPSMPKKHGGIRISLTRHLHKADLDALVQNLVELFGA